MSESVDISFDVCQGWGCCLHSSHFVLGHAIPVHLEMGGDVPFSNLVSDEVCHKPSNQLLHGHIVDQDGGYVQVWLIWIGILAVSHLHWLLPFTFEYTIVRSFDCRLICFNSSC